MITWIKNKIRGDKLRMFDTCEYTVVNAAFITGAGLTVSISYQPISAIQHTHGYRDWKGRLHINRKPYIVNLAVL